MKNYFIPWRVLNWINHNCHYIYMLLFYGRVNINTLEYWNRKWDQGGYDISEGRYSLYRQIARSIPKKGSLVLDIGCGDGSFMQILKNEFNTDPVGIDFSEAAIRSVKKKNLDGVVASATNIPFASGTFDVVTSLELLEHLRATVCDYVLLEMKRVCKDGGTVIVTVPTPKSLTPQIEPEHQRTYSKEDIEKLISRFFHCVNVENSEGGIYWVASGNKCG